MYGVNGHEIMTEVAKLLNAIRSARQTQHVVKADVPESTGPNEGFPAQSRRQISPTRLINVASLPDGQCQALDGVGQR